MDWKTLLFSFGGRINRGKYWLGVLIVILAYVAAAIIFGVFYAVAGTAGAIIGGIALLAAFVVGVWGSIAIGIKRLHDREKSGWWLLLFYLVPGMMSGIGQAMGDIMGIAISLASFAITIWGFVELGCLKGTTGPNQYGPDPLPAEPD
jgi:uncharacterized membrane protein YhaH (DUF805 family)